MKMLLQCDELFINETLDLEHLPSWRLKKHTKALKDDIEFYENKHTISLIKLKAAKYILEEYIHNEEHKEIKQILNNLGIWDKPFGY